MKFYVNMANGKTIIEKEEQFFQSNNLVNKISVMVTNTPEKYFLCMEFLLANGRRTTILDRDAFAIGESAQETKDGVIYDVNNFTLTDRILSVPGMLQFTCYCVYTDNAGNEIKRRVVLNGTSQVVKTVGYGLNDIVVVDNDEEDAAEVIGSFRKMVEGVDLKLATKVEQSTFNSKVAELVASINTKANASEVYKKTETYSQSEVDTKLGLKADKSTTYTKDETNDLLAVKADKTELDNREYTNITLKQMSTDGKKAIPHKEYVDTEIGNAVAGHIKSANVTINQTTGIYTMHFKDNDGKDLFTCEWDTPDEYIIDTEKEPLVNTEYNEDGSVKSQTTTIYLYGGKSFTIDTTSLALKTGSTDSDYVKLVIDKGKIKAVVSNEFTTIMTKESERQSAENVRISNENQRGIDEGIRQENETQRGLNELDRQATHSEMQETLATGNTLNEDLAQKNEYFDTEIKPYFDGIRNVVGDINTLLEELLGGAE